MMHVAYPMLHGAHLQPHSLDDSEVAGLQRLSNRGSHLRVFVLRERADRTLEDHMKLAREVSAQSVCSWKNRGDQRRFVRRRDSRGD
jgi:hypothetical protein